MDYVFVRCDACPRAQWKHFRNLQYREYKRDIIYSTLNSKRVDPGSRQIGIAVNAALRAVSRNGLSEVMRVAVTPGGTYRNHWSVKIYRIQQRPIGLKVILILQVRLSRRYRAQIGAPTLVLLEGSTGRLITSNGCDRLSEDPTGALFPWTPRALIDVLKEAGPYLPGGKRAAVSKLSAPESKVRYSDLDGLVKGIYFSAHWVSNIGWTYRY
jgi:hypothetical protein